DWIDPPENARNHVTPPHPVDVRIDAVTRRATDCIRHLGGVDEHLRRNASDVQTGAAEGALLADRRPLTRVAIVENAVARTRSDDRDVVGFHCASAAYPFDGEASVSSVALR